VCGEGKKFNGIDIRTLRTLPVGPESGLRRGNSRPDEGHASSRNGKHLGPPKSAAETETKTGGGAGKIRKKIVSMRFLKVLTVELVGEEDR
jgi:hypothetical protein